MKTTQTTFDAITNTEDGSSTVLTHDSDGWYAQRFDDEGSAETALLGPFETRQAAFDRVVWTPTSTTLRHHVKMAQAFAQQAIDLAAGLPLDDPAQQRAELARGWAFDQPITSEVTACTVHADCRALCEWIEAAQ